MMQHVVLLLLGAHLAYAGTHSLRYFYTAVSGDIDFPEFTVVGLVDEGQFMYFDSKTKEAVPKTEWMRQSEGADYWDRQTQGLIGHHQVFKNNIQVAKERFNQSTGVHTVQVMYGCERNDETGVTDGFCKFGYDGEDFLHLDLKEMRFISPVQQGFPTAQKLNHESGQLEGRKHYFSTVCIEWLQKYVQYGKSSLKKTASPQVSLLQKTSSSPVTCHATGFYPSGVTISWMRNDQEHHEDVEVGELLPNEDGTFQKRSTIKVRPDEWKNNKFSCVVEHQGKTITADEIRTNTGDSAPTGIIVLVVATVAIVHLIVFAAVCIKRTRCTKYEKKEKLASVCSNVKNIEALKTLDSCPDPRYNSSLDSESDIGSVHSDSSSCDSTTTLLQRKMTDNDTR